MEIHHHIEHGMRNRGSEIHIDIPQEDLEGNKENVVKPYSIDIAEFDEEHAPHTPLSWVDGQRVVRDNFTDFLATSFAVSLGRQTIHNGFFIWLKQTNGFDISKINPIANEVWQRLSREERDYFAQRMPNSKSHHMGKVGNLYGTGLSKGSETWISNAIGHAIRKGTEVLVRPHLYEMGTEQRAGLDACKTLEDFKKLAVELRRENKNWL